VSEDEDGSRNAQVALDPMQICLYPTHVSLEQRILQHDMRLAMKALVSAQLQQEYPDRFGYFDFNDFQEFAWYSGEEDDPVCGDWQGVLPGVSGRQGIWGQTNSDKEPMPCTCALYPGAVVFIFAGPDYEEIMNVTVMETRIATILEEGLVGALQDIASDSPPIIHGNDVASGRDSTLPAYFELQAAVVSFDVAMRQDGGDLVLPPEETDSPTRAPTRPPVEFFLTQAPTVNPHNDNTVSGLEAGNSLSPGAQGNMERYGMALIIGVAILVFLTCLCLCYVRLRRFGASSFCCCCCIGDDDNDLVEEEEVERVNRQNSRDYCEKRDTSTVVGEEEEDEEEGRRTSDGATAQSGAASEMTNYQAGELLECVSVASEWTGDSNSQDKSSTAGYSSRMLVAAELMAAKETFDRNIILQKDMLHSEWSATPVSGAFDSAAAADASKDDNALSFEQAYESSQGEEVYLTPPRSARKSFRRDELS
jgi:hypothetical protein